MYLNMDEQWEDLKELLKEVMNLGMSLRQNQLQGYITKSGNEELEDFINENEERIAEILFG